MPNPDVIELLEAYLDVARKNEFAHIAISMVGHPNLAALDFAGDPRLELSQREALGHLVKKFETLRANTTPPPTDPTLDASFVCYNLMEASLGYDFINWLIIQEMTRLREGAPVPLRVGFWQGRDKELTVGNRQQREMWLHNLFRPALKFVRAIEDPRAVSGRQTNCYTPRDVVVACNKGEEVPRLNSPSCVSFRSLLGPFITITLRETVLNQDRNSRVDEWLRFARWLEDQGEKVIIVRDTAKVNEPLDGFQTCPQASIDAHTRMALYEQAKLNCFVSNGPSALALYSEVPWLTFVTINTGVNNARFWKECMGVTPGGQFPWSSESQRLVWKLDTFENMVEAFQSISFSKEPEPWQSVLRQSLPSPRPPSPTPPT